MTTLIPRRRRGIIRRERSRRGTKDFRKDQSAPPTLGATNTTNEGRCAHDPIIARAYRSPDNAGFRGDDPDGDRCRKADQVRINPEQTYLIAASFWALLFSVTHFLDLAPGS